MRRMLTIAAMFALALPNLAAAEEHHPPGKPGGAKPGVAQSRSARRIPAVRTGHRPARTAARWRVRTAAR